MTPATLVTEYVWVEFWQGLADPDIVLGCEGAALMTDTAREESGPLPQELAGITEIFPLKAPTVAVMLYVPCPRGVGQPEGTVHV